MEKLLPYFERELSMLRRSGAEFASRYPKLAGSLQMSGETCADPHVERLIQASAFLNARTAKLLDDGYANFTEALLGMLYPHYLRPIPSCSIAHVDYGGASGNVVTSVTVLPRGTALKSLGRGAISCRFRSVYDVTVAPVAICAAWFEPYIQAPSTLPLPAEAGSAICITIDSTATARGLASLELSTLRVFIDCDASLRAALRDMLFMRAACACVEANGQWRLLDGMPIAPAGFAAEDALLPAAASEHSAYRLLSEYFAFPEKFDFFDIDLSALLAASPADCSRLTLRIALADVRPDAPAARILRTLSAEHLLLGCTPVINLYQQAATPIRVDHRRSSYPLMPDEMPGNACEIYSIDTVQLLRKAPQGNSLTEFFPYYSLRHGEQDSRKGHYWLAHRDEELADAEAGHEYTLALLDRDFSPLTLDEGTASVRLTCTNRNLPHGLPYGRAAGDLSAEAAIGGFPIRLLRRPTLSWRQPAGANRWGLIAQLALNHRSLTQEGLPALTAMLRLYAQQDSAVSQRQIDGVMALSQQPATAWVRQARGKAYLRGVEVRVSLDEEAYAGTGVHAFAQVLDHLFGLHVHLNSFTQLVVLSHGSGKELLRCLPRNGALTLA
ncbi:type VI secretion system baseplate subunit TssF [Duganella sp. BJB488]|uniref:type VI secretion system baseplate subunit TssF n=1 Tax=unclassified Duganella TaxID=2636909 RepID=UPI000E34B272|nr:MULTISPECIES: type VI secretion system baseplate subunit TssF [unclassified Duganella]RFP09090.1 type VI secretion system baseplate subunit TssF [Duganella sp. BJB489]RFP12521.1 type VI secretion system baseplate subunit TssF [Duganella sp. BJB488]RFP29090.1 type VI secretion system baseplate subunit TssF [Duganella sp. BJB480]